jgi:glycosyltransferase involved in cell wall biosynthesis
MSRVAGRRLLLVLPSGTSFLTFLRGVADRWRDMDGAVAVACGPNLAGHEQSEWPAGVERLAIPIDRAGGLSGTVRAAGRLRRLVAGWRPDIVHSHFATAALVAAVASLGMSPGNPLWMSTFHGLHATVATTWRSRLAGLAESFSAARMSTAWVLNDEDRVYLDLRVGRGIVERVPGFGVGCDLAHFDPQRFTSAERSRLREQLGMSPRARALIFIGRCTAFKGFNVAIRAFEEAARSYPDLHLIVVGAIDEVHGSGLSSGEWQRLVMNDRIHLLGWQADVAPWLLTADLCVFPSEREGMPVNVMESLAMGVPVVTFDSRGCRDVVRDKVDGSVVREQTTAALAREIQALLADTEKLARFAANALVARDRFDRHKYVDFQIAAYVARLDKEMRQAA